MIEGKEAAKKTVKPVKVKKTGRPSKYTEDLALEICKRIAEGESLLKICKDDHVPHRATISTWLVDGKHESFHDKYKRAVDVRTDNMFDELVNIADDDSGDVKITQSGEAKMDSEYVARSRIRIDTRKWYLSKVMPKKYGDKLDVTSKDEKISVLPILGGTSQETPKK
jgi:hypothetical protein